MVILVELDCEVGAESGKLPEIIAAGIRLLRSPEGWFWVSLELIFALRRLWRVTVLKNLLNQTKKVRSHGKMGSILQEVLDDLED